VTGPRVRKTVAALRSQRWFGANDFRSFSHRQRTQQMGLRREEFVGKPVVAILNTWSEMSPCHRHLRERAEAVKRGVWQAGGYPVEIPVISVGEVLVKPTTMLYRNFLAMEAEEMLRSHPVDGAVLLGGCDKSTPALLMGAISMNLPAIFCPAGAMSNDYLRGQRAGAGTHTKFYWDELRAGRISPEEWVGLEARMTRSAGTCNTMGTASTMASLVEALGVGLPGNAAVPAVDARRRLLARDVGVRSVGLVHADLRLSEVLTRPAFENAVRVNAALGGSTNAVIHLLAIAGRIGVDLTIDDIDALGRTVPLLVDLKPAGRYLMEDFFAAGGVPTVIRELGGLLDTTAITVTGASLGQVNADAAVPDGEVVRERSAPLATEASIAVLRGNLAPNGALIKPSAASRHLLRHRGTAVVFAGMADFRARIDDPALGIDENSVVVLTGAGPRGYPGMPEVGNLALPVALLRRGVRDIVRISDARMSGTAFGTVVLHVTPESAVGGPLALVRDGDVIELDVPARRLHLAVSDDELANRRARWRAPDPVAASGYQKLYVDHVLQADRGADFDFLVGRRGSVVQGDNH
jgi:L-arabonate dehydrase